MRSCLVKPCKPLLVVRIALIATLTLLLSGWTCNAMFEFQSCQGAVPQPQITSLSPGAIPNDAQSVLLEVSGSGFTSHSQILWNGSALETKFTDSRHLQTTITQQTFDSFGGAAGSTVQISVRAQESVADLKCQNGAHSGTMVLVIN